LDILVQYSALQSDLGWSARIVSVEAEAVHTLHWTPHPQEAAKWHTSQAENQRKKRNVPLRASFLKIPQMGRGKFLSHTRLPLTLLLRVISLLLPLLLTLRAGNSVASA